MLTAMILVHREGQTQIHNAAVTIPPLPGVIHLYETVASAGGAFGAVPVVAIALNTAHLNETSARQAIAAVEQETQLPCSDVVRFGAKPLLDAISGQIMYGKIGRQLEP